MSIRSHRLHPYFVLALIVALPLAGVAIADAAGDAAEKARITSASNLRQLNEALQLYGHENRGHLPRDWERLEASDEHAKEINSSPYADPAKPERFTYLLKSARFPLGNDRPVAIDAASLDLEDGAHVLFADSKVQWLTREQLDELAERSAKQYPDNVSLGQVLKRAELSDAQRAQREKALVERMSKLEMPALPTKTFFTIDDGATWFADDIHKIPPFEKDGKMAVRAHVFECEHGKTWLSHLERFTPKAKKTLEATPLAQRRVDIDAVGAVAEAYLDYEVKKPGAKDWVHVSDVQRSMDITFPRCPEGTMDILPVYPE